MSSLTAQESSESNPKNPINKGTTSAPGTGSDPGVPSSKGAQSGSGSKGGLSGDKTSEGAQDAEGGEELSSAKGRGESVLDSVEESVHERGEGEHSRAI